MKKILLPVVFIFFGLFMGILLVEGLLQVLNAFHVIKIDPDKSFAHDAFVYSPTLKYTMKPYRTNDCTLWTNPPASCSGNAYGFRDIDHPVEKPENTYRILLIGDSLTYGPGVNWKDSYPGILGNILQRKKQNGKEIEILNMGMIFYGPEQYYNVYQEYGKQYHPDLVIIGVHTMTDAYEAYEFDTNKKFYFLKSLPDRVPYVINEPLKHHSLLWRTLFSAYYAWANKQEIPVEKMMFKGAKNRFHHDSALYTSVAELRKGWEIAEGHIQHLVQDASSQGAKVVVVAFPPPSEIDPASWKDLQKKGFVASEKLYTDSQSRKNFHRMCAHHKWSCLDLHDSLRSASDPAKLFLENDIHYTGAGNKIAAQTIYEEIKKYLPH